MTEQEDVRVLRDLADLRLKVNALEIVSKSTSLAEMLKQMRRAIWWSALLVVLALLGSSFVRVWQDHRVRELEDRLQTLEQR